MRTFAIRRQIQSTTALRPLNFLSKKLILNPVRYLTEFKSIKFASATEMVFSAIPKDNETKKDFKTRVKLDIQKMLFTPAYANHVMLMSYGTRISKPEEKLSHVASPKIAMEISFDKPIITGHCLMSLINKQGEPCNRNTFSSRPDFTKPTVYQANVAHDARLPKEVDRIIVKPAIHTSVNQEIASWADDAFYVAHVHRKRPHYPLHCILKPLTTQKQIAFEKMIQELKFFYSHYCLLDHILPHCETGSTIINAQNCTLIIELLEKLNNVNLRTLIGNNPSTQVVTNVFRKFFFENDVNDIRKSGALVEEEDEMSKPYVRRVD